MYCSVSFCPNHVKKAQSDHWKIDRVCAYHAAKKFPEKYPRIVQIVKPMIDDTIRAIQSESMRVCGLLQTESL